VRCSLVNYMLLSFAASAAPAAVQQPIHFRLNLQPGQRWEMDSRAEYQFDGTVGEKTLVLPYSDHDSLGPRGATWEILAVENGAPTSVRVTFDRTCANPADQQPFPFCGRAITVTQLPKARYRRFDHDFAGKADKDSLQELGEFLYAYPSTWFYPDKPVTVGQSWPIARKELSEKFDLQPDDSGRGSCKLLSIGESGGRKTAEIAMNISLTRRRTTAFAEERETVIIRRNCACDMTIRGVVDLDSGLLIREDLDGSIKTSGTSTDAGSRGRTTPINGQGKLKFYRQHRLLLSRMAGASTQPANFSYAGIFSDDRLIIELRGQEGHYTGKIHLGTRDFPVAATESGTGLRGTLQSNGQTFQFTASLNRDGLTLTTGRTTYVLRKQSGR